MMAVNGNQKGKKGELEVAAIIKRHGFEARRGQQYEGSSDSPDVVHSVPALEFEVKRREAINLYQALAQLEADMGEGSTKIPVVVHRKNRTNWLATMDFEDLLFLMTTFQRLTKETPDDA